MPSLHRAAAAAAALSCLPLVPASAVDPVDRSRVAAVGLEVADGSGGTVRLALRIWDAAAGDRVDVRVESCDATGCSYPVFYSGAVDAATAEIDDTSASGRALLALSGHELAVTWEPADGLVVSTGDLTASGESAAGGTWVGMPAATRVVGDRATCATTGAVGDGVRVSLPEGSAGATRPLEALRLPDGTLGCATG